MYLRRKIDDFLLEWKQNSDRMPLIVKGARQVGKTESILHFGKANYANMVYINFATDTKFKGIVVDGYSAEAVVKNITLFAPDVHFEKGNTLIIFDEIQDFPDIATSLKFFKIDGRYDVICSGSLLGINYRSIQSNSVGYKTDYEMFSMDFEEFLWSKGYQETAILDMYSHLRDLRPFSDVEMNVWGGLFRDYCIVGGMPKIVLQYIESKSFEGVLDMQRQLSLDYREDVRKYALGLDQSRILNVFNHIPTQLAKENKKFQISKVSTGARFKDYRGCIEWLNDSGIINVCYCLHYPELPLKGNYDDEKYKIYFKDTGLLIASLDDESQDDLRTNSNFGIYKGALYENIVAEALSKQGYGLYYFKKDNSGLEEDFFVRTRKSLVPLEVKATNGRSKSLSTLVRGDNYPDISNGIKLIGGNVGYDNCIYTFPYFCTFLLKRYLKEVDW
ncbi:MAG: ATP-binding protein [Bacteroidales bacterium]|nr:ATP-binding protein [Bacteroidales bacterium]